MESWHQMRLSRAKEQDIYVKSLDCVDGALIFTVHGVSDVYIMQIEENIEIGWPPQCDCEDYYWRPGVLCKHIFFKSICKVKSSLGGSKPHFRFD